MSRILTISEAAARAGVTPNAIQHKIAWGILPTVDLPLSLQHGRQKVGIEETVLDAYLYHRQQGRQGLVDLHDHDLTIREAAETLGVHHTTIRYWCTHDILPSHWHGKHRVVRRHDLQGMRIQPKGRRRVA